MNRIIALSVLSLLIGSASSALAAPVKNRMTGTEFASYAKSRLVKAGIRAQVSVASRTFGRDRVVVRVGSQRIDAAQRLLIPRASGGFQGEGRTIFGSARGVDVLVGDRAGLAGD